MKVHEILLSFVARAMQCRQSCWSHFHLLNRFPVKNWNEIVQQGNNNIFIVLFRKGEYLFEPSVCGRYGVKGLSFISNRQQLNEGTLRASGFGGD